MGNGPGRRRVGELCKERPNLTYLSDAQPIALSPQVGLVGHDGWADGRLGDYERSYVMMNDYRLIAELAGYSKEARWAELMRLGDAAADYFAVVLPVALQRYPHVYLATHVPPWHAACWYRGQLSDDEWAPHFTCDSVGFMILDVMQSMRIGG